MWFHQRLECLELYEFEMRHTKCSDSWLNASSLTNRSWCKRDGNISHLINETWRDCQPHTTQPKKQRSEKIECASRWTKTLLIIRLINKSVARCAETNEKSAISAGIKQKVKFWGFDANVEIVHTERTHMWKRERNDFISSLVKHKFKRNSNELIQRCEFMRLNLCSHCVYFHIILWCATRDRK